ncbi:hypothetical protein [Fusobacterium sp. THCT1E2]
MEKAISPEEMLFKMLGEGEQFFVNRKLITKYGLDLAMFISTLIERLRDYVKSNEISDDREFSMTDVEIALYAGIEYKRIDKIRQKGIKEKLFTVRKTIEKDEIYYKLNEEKIAKIILDKKEKIKVPSFKKNL